MKKILLMALLILVVACGEKADDSSYDVVTASERIFIFEELESVVNLGLAIEIRLSEIYKFYAGFTTDFSAVSPRTNLIPDNNEEIYNSSLKANIYHFSGGLGMEFKKLHVTLGMAYNYGIDYISRPVDIPNGGNDPIFDNEENSTLKISNWKLLFGFAIPVSK